MESRQVRSHRNIRLGFTLIELLVVIAIIGVLTVLLLPAVQAAREAARKTQCQNNIRQIALAIVSYEGLKGHFPESQTASGRKTTDGQCEAGFYSWHARILPFVEESNMFQQIDFDRDLSDYCNDGEHGLISPSHPNAGAAMSVIDTYLCPSDGFLGNHREVMGIDSAPNNYAGNAGWPSLTTGFDGERPAGGRYNGLINLVNPRSDNRWQPRTPVRAKHVRDGLSKTAAVAERLIQRGSNRESILGGSHKTLSYHLTERARTLAEMAARCGPEHTHPDLSHSAYLGRSWISGWAPAGGTYMHVMPPNTSNCHFSHSLLTGDFIVTPTSNHSGGVNVAFADGHVRFVADDVDPGHWWAMGSRNGGETTDVH